MSVLAAIKGIFSCFGREKAPIHPPVQLPGPPWTRAFFSGRVWIDPDGVGQRCLTDLRGRRCFGGLDLDSTSDMAAFSLVFPPLQAHRAWSVLVWAWIPRRCLNKKSEFADAYQYLIETQCVNVSSDERNDYRPVVAAIRQACADFDVADIGVDGYNSQVMAHPSLSGVHATCVSPAGEAARAALKYMNCLRREGSLLDGGNPLLGWCANHAAVHRDDQQRFFLAKNLAHGPIAPLTATVLAISRALADEKVAALSGSAALRS